MTQLERPGDPSAPDLPDDGSDTAPPAQPTGPPRPDQAAAPGADSGSGGDGDAGKDGPEKEEYADPAPEAPVVRPTEAFDALYTRHAAELLRQATVLTGHPARARRALRHAFRRAWQHWPEVARDPDPGGWVRAAAHEAALSPWRLPRPGAHLPRARRRRPSTSASRPAAPPAPTAASATARHRLLDALLRLPPSYRRTLVLHDGLGLGLSATAAETEASTTAAAGRLTRARGALAVDLPELGLARLTSPERGAALHEVFSEATAALPASPPPARHVRRAGEYRARLLVPGVLTVVALFTATAVWAGSTAPRHAAPDLTTALAVSPDPAGPLPGGGPARPGSGAPASGPTAAPSSDASPSPSSSDSAAAGPDGSASPSAERSAHHRPGASPTTTDGGGRSDRERNGPEGGRGNSDDGARDERGTDAGFRKRHDRGAADTGRDGRYAGGPGVDEAATGTADGPRRRHDSGDGENGRGGGRWGPVGGAGASPSGRRRRHHGAGGGTASPWAGHPHASARRQSSSHRHPPAHSSTGGWGPARGTGSPGGPRLPAGISPGYGDSEEAPAADTGTGTGPFDDAGAP